MLITIIKTFLAALAIAVPWVVAMCFAAKRGDEAMEKFLEEYRRTHL